jgi:hypothetical protein
MPFQVSPGIVVTERDLTTVVPNVATSIGAIGGSFQWGPVLERQTVTTENDLVRIFGEPKDTAGTAMVVESFHVAANYLAYTNNLIVVRNVGASARNAVVGDGDAGTATVVQNIDDYDSDIAAFTDQLFLAKYPGAKGNSLKVHAIDSFGWDKTDYTGDALALQKKFKAAFDRRPSTSSDVARANGWDGVTTDYIMHTATAEAYTVGDTITQATTSATGTVVAIPGGYAAGGTLVAYTPTAGTFLTTGGNIVSSGTGNAKTIVATKVVKDEPVTRNNDELHVMVIDEDGLFTNEPGEVLERHAHVSKAKDAKRIDGGSNYVSNVLRTQSSYVWFGAPGQLTANSTGAGANAGALKSGSTYKSFNSATMGQTLPGGSLTGGVDDNDLSIGELISAYELYKEPEVVDVTLVMAGAGNTTVSRWIIDNISSVRKDCVALVSPNRASVVNPASNSAAVDALEADNTALGSSSYAIMDGAWKYQYDRYNDVFTYIPMNGDMAGLCARTDFTNDAWWSPAGYNRGTIKNIVKLSWEANKANRDVMYQIGVNPLITPRGAGVLLFGDKTMQVLPSAFDRINVRRLFIVLEKAIAIAAKALLFEFNDEFTRAQFVNIVSPFLRDVQGRRGITDFKVVCDSSNNTGQVIDTNNFVGDIYIKPARSINFIQLNFIAARTDVSFSEIGG